MYRGSAVQNSSTNDDQHIRTLSLSCHEESSGELEEAISILCECFKVKLNIKEDSQATSTDHAFREDNYMSNSTKEQSLTNSGNQCTEVTKLVPKFSRQNSEMESSSINTTLSSEIKNTPTNSCTNAKALSTAEESSVTGDTNDSATGKKGSRSQSTANRQSSSPTNGSNCENEEDKDTNARDQKADRVNNNKGGETESQPSTTVKSKQVTNKTMDCVSRDCISDISANKDHESQTGRDAAAEQGIPKDDAAENMRNTTLCKKTQPREDSSDTVAKNINLSVLNGELNLGRIIDECKKFFDQVQNIQKSSEDHLQNRNSLLALRALLNFKDIASSGLLCESMPNNGLDNDNIHRMIGLLLPLLNFLVPDGMLLDPSGKANENQDQGQVKNYSEVSMDNSSGAHTIVVTKEIFTDTSIELASNTKYYFFQTDASRETKDTYSQTEANCETKVSFSQTAANCETKVSFSQTDVNSETCSKCVKDTVSGEKENTEVKTMPVTTDTHQNGNKRDYQRGGTKAKIKAMQIRNVVISHDKSVCKNEKVLLLLGASGCGKTTLVKLIACFYTGIKSPDEYLVDDTRYRIENLVNHSTVTAFTAYPGNPDNPAITIIDTPGLNDSSGELIQSRIDDLQRFLRDAVAHGLEINAIGFVIQAHVARLTPSERLVMDYVKRHFKKRSTHIIPMITFADSQKDPPVLKAMKEFDVNVNSHFLFNNSVLTFDDDEEISDMDKLFWKRGFKCWQNICKLLLNLPSVKISHIRSKPALVFKQFKSETKLTVPTAEKKVAPVQTDINNSCMRRDQSTNTDMDAFETELQKPCFFISAERDIAEAKIKAMDAFQNTIIRFSELLDRSCERPAEWKLVREEVWKKAVTAFHFVDLKIPCDTWVYSVAYEILRQRQASRPPQDYVRVLALSETQPLVHVGLAVIRNTRAVYNQINRYLRNTFICRFYVAHIQEIVIENTMKTLHIALVAHKAHEVLNTESFLRNLCLEADEALSKFIHCELLRHRY